MKRLNNFLFQFELLSIAPEDIESVKVVFEQGHRRLLFDTSDGTRCYVKGNIVSCIWKAADTLIFVPGEPMYMDTFVKIKDTIFNPETEKVELIMSDSLFRREEVIVDD